MGFNDALGMAGSWPVASAAPLEPRPGLRGYVEADLVVVGAGCTGLSAALHAARRGLKVVVLEGGRVGWGASGRNGGQMIPGLRQSAVKLCAKLGVEPARALLDLAFSARDLVLGLIEQEAIDCDLRTSGHLLGAAKPADLRWMEAEAACLLDVIGYADVDLFSRAQAREAVATDFHGALLDRRGGHLHPLKYVQGLARAAEAAGAVVFEESPVKVLDRGARPLARTAAGSVRAAHAVLAGDAFLRHVAPAVETRVMPVGAYQVATEPLADPQALIAHDLAVSDSRFVVDYYRLSPDGRLIFGGGERYAPGPPGDIAAFVRPFLERTFPQLKGVRIDYAWGGLVAITRTRLPHLGREGEVLFAHGYSGQGVLLSTLGGKLLVDEIVGESAAFQRFADLAPAAFPGGRALRAPLHVLGMLWYALQDRL